MDGTERRRMAPCSRRRVVGMGVGLAGVAGLTPALLGAGCAPEGAPGATPPRRR